MHNNTTAQESTTVAFLDIYSTTELDNVSPVLFGVYNTTEQDTTSNYNTSEQVLTTSASSLPIYNTTEQLESTTSALVGIDEIYVLIGNYLIFVVSTPLASFGVIANLVNLIIFHKQGRRDCVSISLFSLAVSDLCCCLTVLVFSSVYTVNYLRNFSIIDPIALDEVLSYISAMFYDISQGIIAFISLQRCLCVAKPLTFKNMFTAKRSFYIMVFLYVCTTLSYLPHYLTCGLYQRFNPLTNATIWAMWQTSDRKERIGWLNYILHIGVETCYQIVVAVSAIVMIYGLKKSARFRQQETQRRYITPDGSSNLFTVDKQPRKCSQDLPKTSVPAPNSSGKGFKRPGTITANPNTLTDKNRNVVITIFALALMAIICNTERLIAVYGQRFVPEFTFAGKYRNFFAVTARVTFLFSMINASTNVLVYYNLNPSYRMMFLKTFCSCRKEILDNSSSASEYSVRPQKHK